MFMQSMNLIDFLAMLVPYYNSKIHNDILSFWLEIRFASKIKFN